MARIAHLNESDYDMLNSAKVAIMAVRSDLIAFSNSESLCCPGVSHQVSV